MRRDEMFRKLWKIAGGLALAAAVLLTGGQTARAADSTVDWSRTGSVSVTPRSVEEGHEIVKGTSFLLYRVAEAAERDQRLVYTPTEAFAGSGAELSDPNAEGLAQTLADYAEKAKLSGTEAKAGADGSVTFGNLPLGLYLLVQKDTVPGYRAAAPFLVSVPAVSGDGTAWIYDVDASPKAEWYAVSDITVKKQWNDGNSKSRPDRIRVGLYLDDTLLDTVTLDAEHQWSYTWKDLEKSDRYSVKETAVKGYTATYNRKDSVFTITNTAKLAQTGQQNWPVPVLAGAGVAVFALGWALAYLKKKEKR